MNSYTNVYNKSSAKDYLIILILIILLIVSIILFVNSKSNIPTEYIKLNINETFITSSIKCSSDLFYENSDTDVVSIDESGKMYALQEGNARVLLRNNDDSICNIYEILVSNEDQLTNNSTLVNNILIEDNIVIKEGEIKKIDYSIEPSNANEKVIFTSNDENVVITDGNVIKGINVGETTITVSTNSNLIKKIIHIKVEDNENINHSDNIEKASIKFDTTKIELNVNEQYQVKYLLKNIDENELIWNSSNKQVATINNGLITAISEGTSIITLMSSNKASASMVVYVKGNNTITNISLTKNEININLKEKFNLSQIIIPNTLNMNDIVFDYDSNIIQIDKAGIITGVNIGEANIKIKVKNGNTAYVKIKVSETLTKVESILLNKSNLTMYIGNKEILSYQLYPSNSSAKNLTWNSSNPNVVSINNGAIEAIGIGTSIITLKTDEGIEASCKITVKDIEISKIILNKDTLSLKENETYQLSYSIYPTNASNQKVIWNSSDNTIASVSSNGLIIANKVGTAIITATTENGKSADLKVTIDYATFTNPIASKGADPWVIQKDGYYYYTFALGKKIYVLKEKNLYSLRRSGATLIYNNNTEVWAPELHFLNGKWYVYFTAPNVENEDRTRRMHVIEGLTNNPQGNYKYVGKITDSSNKWAIDGTIMNYKNNLYFIWSGWEGNEGGKQNLYIAHMSSPTKIDGNRIMISTPIYDWEKNGMPVNEGPEILVKNNNYFIIYSASGAWTEHYCLGMLTLIGSNPLDYNSWKKNATPIFKSGNGVYGPGHASFVKSNNGLEDWIVYHAYPSKEATSNWSNRDIRIQKFNWRNNIPYFGSPVPSNTPINVPN